MPHDVLRLALPHVSPPSLPLEPVATAHAVEVLLIGHGLPRRDVLLVGEAPPAGHEALRVVADQVAEPWLPGRDRFVDDPGDVQGLARRLHLHLVKEQQAVHVHRIGRRRVREPLRLVKMGVTTTPGSTTATRIPKACTSWARTSLAASRACFTAE